MDHKSIMQDSFVIENWREIVVNWQLFIKHKLWLKTNYTFGSEVDLKHGSGHQIHIYPHIK